MKKALLLTSLFISLALGGSVVSDYLYSTGLRENGQYRIWIYFKDKPESESVRLSPRTWQRRSKINQSRPRWEDRLVSPDYIQKISGMGIEIIHESRWLNAVSAWSDEQGIARISRLPFVKSIEPVRRYTREKEFPAEMSAPGSLRSDTSWYGFSWDQIAQIQVNTAHDSGYTGQGVRVLVMDTGFWLEHQAFDNLNLVAQWDVINDDSVCANENNTEMVYGQDSHGTMVLSTMAAYWPDTLIGPAYNAEFLLAKTEDVTQEVQIEEDNYVAGLEWGEALGADVVSTSLGYLDWYTYCDMDGATAVTTRAIDIAASLGVTCVTAMGNEGYYAPPNDPCNDPLTYYMIAPADADSVIAVGAVSRYGTIASFSSHGPTYDGRIKPEVCARGVNTYCVLPHSTGYTDANGTSLATPLVGGAAAVILSARPDWSPMDVRNAMMATATRADNPDNDYGYGILQVWDAIQYGITQDTDPDNVLPGDFAIRKAYPNPFNAGITFALDIPGPVPVALKIFSINGTLVTTLYEGSDQRRDVTWQPGDIPSGIYFAELTWPGGSAYRKITLLK